MYVCEMRMKRFWGCRFWNGRASSRHTSVIRFMTNKIPFVPKISPKTTAVTYINVTQKIKRQWVFKFQTCVSILFDVESSLVRRYVRKKNHSFGCNTSIISFPTNRWIIRHLFFGEEGGGRDSSVQLLRDLIFLRHRRIQFILNRLNTNELFITNHGGFHSVIFHRRDACRRRKCIFIELSGPDKPDTNFRNDVSED